VVTNRQTTGRQNKRRNSPNLSLHEAMRVNNNNFYPQQGAAEKIGVRAHHDLGTLYVYISCFLLALFSIKRAPLCFGVAGIFDCVSTIISYYSNGSDSPHRGTDRSIANVRPLGSISSIANLKLK